jgi:succinoglycan biosynthesis transport protein ExoP
LRLFFKNEGLCFPLSLTLLPRAELPPWPSTAPAATLADQVLLLRRRWLTLVLAALLVPAIAWVALGIAGTPYSAVGIMLYDPAGAAPPGDLPPDLGTLVSNAVVTSQAAIIDSLPAARELTVRLHLAGDPEFDPAARRHIWSRWWPLHRAELDPDAVANRVRAAMNVAVPSDSNVMTISFTSHEPALSAAAVNLAMDLYLDRQRDEAFSNVTAEEAWLAGHETALEGQLDATEAALSQARAAAGIVSGEQVSITTEAASRLAGSLVDAKAQLAMAQARLDEVGKAAASADAASADAASADAQIAPNMLPMRTEQADLASQISALAGQYGDAYPPLVADRAQLSAINTALADETARELASAQADVAADQAQVATLSSALTAARVDSQTQDADTAPIRAFEQRETAQKAMLQNMDLQADQLAQQAALTKTDARILSAAAPPPGDAGPRNGEILAAAGLLGLCLGLLLVQLSEHLDSSFCAGGALRAATGLACLALVPEVKDPLLAPLVAPLSLFAEQLRGLRTTLTADGVHRVIAITAARPSEGKTTLTIALARALAAGGVAVLAIDGDVRQPSFDAVFKTAGAPGLTDILAGLTNFDDAVLQDGASKLRVLAAGTQTRDALSLFLSPALPALLAQLRTEYEMVLLDVPPAFALAEARILARLADAALLCVRWGKTPSRVVLASITLLREAQVNLIGAALTRVNARRHKNSGFPDAEMYQPRYGGYFRS